MTSDSPCFPGASSATAKTGQSRQSYNEAVLLLWDYPMGAAYCYAASAPHSLRRGAVRVGSCLYKNRRRITRQRQNEIVNFKICMTCRITAAWIGIDAKVYMIHGTIDFMLTCLIS